MMANSDSSLVSKYCWLSSYNYATQKSKIVSIATPHHAAGDLTIEAMARVWKGKQVSATYGIQSNGVIGQFVHEKDRAYTSCNKQDSKATTIEVANCKGAPYWEVSDAAVKSLITLLVDVCKRNNLPGFTWTGDAKGTLTCHYMFKATACPGPYLKALMPWIAAEVTGRVAGVITGDIKIPKVTFDKKNNTVVKNSVVTKTPEPQKLKYVFNDVDLSPVFDYKYYADRYDDLKKAFGYNELALWNHFCVCGMKEHRKASSMFDPVIYRKKYKNVEDKYGDNWMGYYAHYCLFGIKEGKSGL